MNTRFQQHLEACALVAILRGLMPSEAVSIGRALIDSGFCMIEVPLNSPEPFASIAALSDEFGSEVLIGAGTVLSPTDVDRTRAAGGKLIVSPNCDPATIGHAVRSDMVCLPGVYTPTEAFAALAAGASGLKLFPADRLAPGYLKAMRAVLPAPAVIMPVGGIGPDAMAPWLAAGASGFGLGSGLYRPGMSAEEVRARARDYRLGLESARSAS